VRRGENFCELYMIFDGKVIVSLNSKFIHEFFMLHATNYFGDYQILEDHRATETYCAFTNAPVFVHCMKSRKFIDILKTFPDAMAIFFLRAQARRKEFRRIRKQYERWVGFDGRTNIEKLPQTMKDKAQICNYDDSNMPKHLTDTEFYFVDTFKARLRDRDSSMQLDFDKDIDETDRWEKPIELTALPSI